MTEGTAEAAPLATEPPDPSPVGWRAEMATWRSLLSETWRARLLLIVVFAIALALRFHELGEASLWLDELGIRETALGESNIVSSSHRLHLALVAWSLKFLPDGAWGVRAWSALSGSLAAPLLALAAVWISGRRAGWIAGLMAAMNPYLVFYSQDADYYGAMGAFASAELAFAVAAARGGVIGAPLIIAAIGVASHFNHPFGSLMTGTCLAVAGLAPIVYGPLRRSAYAFSPRAWIAQPALPLAIAAIVAGVLAGSRVADPAWATLREMWAWGHPLPNVSFTSTFFGNQFDRFFIGMYGRSGTPSPLAWLLLATSIAGGAWMGRLAWRGSAAAGVALAAGVGAIIAGFGLLFNLDYHLNFNTRYLTFLVPVLVLGQAFAAEAAATIADRPDTRRGVLGAIGASVLLLIVPVWSLAGYFHADFSNVREAARILADERHDGEPIFIPIHEDVAVARAYLGKMKGRDLWTTSVDRFRAAETLPSRSRSYLLHRLFGEKSAWIMTAWRYDGHVELWDLLDAIPLEYEGVSRQGPHEDARLRHWTFGRRVLLPSAASRFECPELAESRGSSRWLLAGPGRWRVRVLSGAAGWAELGVHTKGSDEVTVSFDGEWMLVTAGGDEPLEVTLEAPREGLAFEARPDYPTVFRVHPGDTIDYAADLRNAAADFKGEPAIRREFDGGFAYLLWADPSERRLLELKLVTRTTDSLTRDLGEKPDDRTPEILIAVACDGNHMGMWYLPETREEIWASVTLDLELPPGNHLLEFNLLTPRLSNKRSNPILWGGFEWIVDKGQERAPSLERAGRIKFAELGAVPKVWGDPTTDTLAVGVIQLNAGYKVRTSPTVTGPSGAPALEFALDGTPKDLAAKYHVVGLGPVPARDGTIFGYSTYIRNDASTTHDVAAFRVIANAQGRELTSGLGVQGKMGSEGAAGWRRYVEVTPIFPGMQAAWYMPGVIVFPPDPAKANPTGSIFVDSIRSLAAPPIAPFRHDLDPGLFWGVERSAE